ncbi:BglI family type II restriction endonuclease, partial [Salmonella enterica]|nr:BglI family type II restriction endonuclease [Salmonella enterica]
YPFWQNYPPDNRGRQPRGDQFPWIEVGEHTIGRKLTRNLSYDFELYDIGVPTGADERFLLKSQEIRNITHGIFDSAFLSIDIKSVGPRDDFFHAVMSHNQISGDGQWNIPEAGMVNTPLKAQGLYASHDFHCSLPPLYVLSDNTVAPVITMAIKPVYDMLSLHTELNRHGQPLKRITLISIPNGLLLTQNPNYLSKY